MGFNDTEQEWKNEFGNSYLKRNSFTLKELDELYLHNYGISRSKLNSEFLGPLDRSSRILEIGCNIGNQLKLLQVMGFRDLWGIDILDEAIDVAKQNTNKINIIKSSAFDIPFKDNFFDIVYTSGVLIHIHPRKLDLVIDRMFHLTRKYIWCFEYYSETNVELEYRGKKGLLWKNDFLKLFTEKFSNLRIIKEKKISYLDNNNIDIMFLLEKC